MHLGGDVWTADTAEGLAVFGAVNNALCPLVWSTKGRNSDHLIKKTAVFLRQFSDSSEMCSDTYIATTVVNLPQRYWINGPMKMVLH